MLTGAPLKWMKALRELHDHFPLESEPVTHFSKLLKSLENHLDLARTAILFRGEGGFKSFSPVERLVIPEGTSHFRQLTLKKKPLTRGVGQKKARSIYWPVLTDGECVACYALELKPGGSGLTDEEKIFMELLADRTAGFLGEKRLWERIQDANRRDIFGWMSAAIVHEIRNPLTALDTLLQLLPRKRGDSLFMDSFQKLMQREIGRLSDLTNDLLDLSNVGLEKMAEVDLREVIQQVAQLMGPLFYSKNIKLRVNVPKSFFLKGNAAQIESLFINLLQNALKAVRSQGVVEISTNTMAHSPYGPGWLWVRVKDNGRGIAGKNIDKIFTPFFSADRSGTGLGLAICQKIVKNHQGYIKVKSLSGIGTVFSLYFPPSPIHPKIKSLPF
jgi:K+-sensing histidine kinase KdpD